MAEIRIYHDGRSLCRAICPELAHRTISLKDITGPAMPAAANCGPSCSNGPAWWTL
ncbi:MAG TPA: hypothetical protein VFV66_35830 [Nonomuraea sp.]|nr:hypothetical protein [Nonomuraea sp.]